MGSVTPSYDGNGNLTYDGMFEYNPMRFDGEDAERVYRHIAYGPALDVLMLDERFDRGPNSPNQRPALNGDSAFLGAAQLAWLKLSLLNSKAMEADRQRHADQPRRSRSQPRRAQGHLRSLDQRR